jgi:hypothetical protein
MNFNVGDIIFQKRDKITFTIVEKKGTKLVLEYYDTHTMNVRSFTISKKQIEKQFTDRPDVLEHFKVILK